MRKPFFFLSVPVFFLFVLLPAFSQSNKGIISGVVKDSGGAVLQGAKIELQPLGRPISTNELGEFNIQEVNPGNYTLTVSYVGFGPYISHLHGGCGSNRACRCRPESRQREQ